MAAGRGGGCCPVRRVGTGVTGLVSVPEGCGRDAARGRGARDAAGRRNLPTPAVVAATQEMLAELGSLGPADLAIALISGGGSALLEAPRPGVPLEEMIAVTAVSLGRRRRHHRAQHRPPGGQRREGGRARPGLCGRAGCSCSCSPT